jgi:integrase
MDKPENGTSAIGKISKIDRTAVKLKPWPSNGLRHSFASYYLSHFKDAARLALELGHTDQELLFRYYRELVTPEQAAKWWDTGPATQTNLVAISAFERAQWTRATALS